MTADMPLNDFLNRVSLYAKISCDQCGDAGRPIQPGIPFFTSKPEHQGGRASALDELALHSLEP
jgi:hypothetical protein